MKPFKSSSRRMSVIIPTTGDIRLRSCLASLRAQSIDQSLFEVLICLNNCDAGIEIDLRENERIITTELGVNAARNTGALNAAGDYLYFLDDDCRVDNPELLERILQYLESHTQVDGVGGPYRLSPQAKAPERTYHRIAENWVRSNIYQAPQCFFLLGGNMCLRRCAFSQDCCFDESIIWGGAELSYFIRAVRQGFIFHWRDEFSVGHENPLSGSAFFRKLVKQSRTTRRYREAGYLLRGDRLQQPEIHGTAEKIYLAAASLVTSLNSPLAIAFYLLAIPFRLLPRRSLRAVDSFFSVFYRATSKPK